MEKVTKKHPAMICKGSIEKAWPGHTTCVLWRRRCRNVTRDPSGYCPAHRVNHTTTRR